ncbi:MAG: helix-turn-helix domain-containing protein, partial [Eubacteriales bacterium]|nr:helix-turn-helix domain-containing protein [Eubacteriales bacterium]
WRFPVRRATAFQNHPSIFPPFILAVYIIPMSKAVTPDEVKKFHRLYEQYGSYAEVARRTGRSASTIGKYIRMAGMTKAHRHAVEQTIGRK